MTVVFQIPLKGLKNEVTKMYETNKHTKVMVFSENGDNKLFWNSGTHLQEKNASWCQKAETVLFNTGKNLKLI